MSTKEITVLVVIAMLLILGFAGVVVFHDPKTPEVAPERSAAPHRLTRPKSDSRIGTADAKSNAGKMNTRQSLEYRLRLYAASGVLQRGRIVYSIRQGIQQYERPLLEILEDETPGIIMPAIEIAGRLENEDSLASLFSLVESIDPRVRSQAVEAISNRRMWERISLRQLLLSERHADVLTAALRAAALVDDAPLDGMLPLLAHGDWHVVRAAQAAMPDTMTEPSLALVDAFVEGAPAGAAVAAVQVLGGLRPDATRNKSILRHLANESWAVQSASLKALILSGGEVVDDEPIWQVIEGAATSTEMRVLAFLALEKTRSIDEPRTLKMIDQLHPVEKLAAARGLVTSKSRAGVRILIDLLNTEISDRVSPDDRACATQCAHQVLQEVAHRVIAPKSELWIPWYRKNEPLPGTPLESQPLLTW